MTEAMTTEATRTEHIQTKDLHELIPVNCTGVEYEIKSGMVIISFNHESRPFANKFLENQQALQDLRVSQKGPTETLHEEQTLVDGSLQHQSENLIKCMPIKTAKIALPTLLQNEDKGLPAHREYFRNLPPIILSQKAEADVRSIIKFLSIDSQ